MVFIVSPRPTCLGIFFLPPELQDKMTWPIAKIFLVSFSFRTLSFKSLRFPIGSPSLSNALWVSNNHLKICWSLAGTTSVAFCILMPDTFSGCASNEVFHFSWVFNIWCICHRTKSWSFRTQLHSWTSLAGCHLLFATWKRQRFRSKVLKVSLNTIIFGLKRRRMGN